MENKKILETAGKELEKEVSAASDRNRIVQGVRSNLLNVLLADRNPQTREELGNPIKEELQKKMDIAKAATPPRKRHIENLQKVMDDLEMKIQGKKTDDERKYLLDLNKNPRFNQTVLNEFVREIFEVAKNTANISKEKIYTKLMKEPEYKEYVIRFIKHRLDGVNEVKQKENLEKILQRLEGKKE